jgi:hypothetical protein
MKVAEGKYQEWEISGLVVGPFLPRVSFVLAEVTFAVISDPQVANLITYRRPTGLKASANVPYVQWSPPSLSVSSTHAAHVVVRAHDENMAMKLGTERIETACMCLAMAADAVAYDFELTAVVPVGESVSSTPFSHAGWIRQWQPQVLSTQIAEQATRIARVVNEDSVVRSSVAYLRKAKSLIVIRSIAPVSTSIFLDFFKIIEVISDHIAQKWRDEHTEELKRKELKVVAELSRTLSKLGVEHLQDGLCKDGDPVSEVKKAVQSINKLQEVYQADEIKRAAELLGVGSEEKNVALDMSRLRNRITHPGQADQDKLRSLLELSSSKEQICPSERAARAFLTAYVKQVA